MWRSPEQGSPLAWGLRAQLAESGVGRREWPHEEPALTEGQTVHRAEVRLSGEAVIVEEM